MGGTPGAYLQHERGGVGAHPWGRVGTRARYRAEVVTTAAVGIAVLGVVVAQDLLGNDMQARLAASLQVAGAWLFFATGILHLALWHSLGRPRNLFFGTALIVYGWLTVPMRVLVLGFDSDHSSLVAGVFSRTSTTVVALVLAVGGVSAISRRRGNTLMCLAALPATICCYLALLLVYWAMGEHLPSAAALRFGLSVALVVVLLGAALVLNAHRGKSHPHQYVVGVLVAAALAQAMRAAAVFRPAWTLAAVVVMLAIALLLVYQVWRYASNALERPRRRHEELTHDANNAATALRAASLTLSKYGDQLSPADRQRLLVALLGEVSHLEHLLRTSAEGARVRFNVRQALEPTIEAQRSSGLVVMEGLGDVHAFGSPGDLAGVVQNLLVNARRHAPGSTVHVHARNVNESLINIYVDDDGPGIPVERREEVFTRGMSFGTGTGLGLGLHVARNLMRDLGGDITVTASPAGGARFVLSMPVSAQAVRSRRTSSHAGLVPETR